MQNEQRSIYYRHFDLPANFPAIGLLGDSWRSPPEPVTRMHFHNCLEIGYLYEGSGRLCMEEKELPFKAPCMVMAPPNVPHAHIVDEGQVCGWKWIYVDPQTMLPHLSPRLSGKLSEYQRGVGADECIFSEEEHGDMLTILRMIVDEMERAQVHYHHITRELFYTLFLLMLRSYSGTAARDGFVNNQLGCIAPAIDYVTKNYMEEISIEDLILLSNKIGHAITGRQVTLRSLTAFL